MRIGVLGGTGPQGRGIAARLAALGEEILLGSREAEKAERVVGELKEQWGDRVAGIEGMANGDAAKQGDFIILGVTAEATIPTATDYGSDFAGKIVVSMANALEKVEGGFAAIVPDEGSLAAAVAKLAPEARVVAALHHVSAKELEHLSEPVEGDVLVCSDDQEAADEVGALISRIPDLKPIQAGGLFNAVGIEAFTAVLLSVNMRHKARTGLHLTGLDR